MGLDEVKALNAGIQPLKGLTNSSGNLDFLNCKIHICLFIAHNLLIVLYIFLFTKCLLDLGVLGICSYYALW